MLVIYLNIAVIPAQVILSANGTGNTYEDINAVLAPGQNVVEVQDCAHTDFGRHIDEIFDTELNINVFRFIAHTTQDNDRCVNFDRQRTEIKTYNSSPDNLKAIEGESVEYKWKFKLDINFQPSTSFTHLHQIKSVSGPYASIPLITLTARKATPDRMELRYSPTDSQSTIETADLSIFKGQWLQVTELISFGNNGSYSIEVKSISNNTTILSYNNENMDTWQDGATIARPKWGIYRSLNNVSNLRDENILFNDFSIEEIDLLSNFDFEEQTEEISLIQNPVKDIISFKNLELNNLESIKIYNSTGKIIKLINQPSYNKIDVSNLEPSLYFISIINEKQKSKVFKFIIE